MKPLGVCNSQYSYERRTNKYGSLRKSPRACKTLPECNIKENSDYSLGIEFSSNRENTGTSPVVVNTMNSNGPQEKKKMKPLRSMLGLRSKTKLTNFRKEDTAFSMLKLLLSSSSNNKCESRENSTFHETHDHQHCKSDSNFTHSSNECISSIESINNNNESYNSTDSYIQNDIIILNQGKINLQNIEEEGGTRDSLCVEDDNVNDRDHEEISATNIMALFKDLKNEKEETDFKWFAFGEQRKVFENKWNNLASMMRMLKENQSTTFKNSRKPKKVICTKLRKSIASSLQVSMKLFKSHNSSSSKIYSELRSNIIGANNNWLYNFN